MQNVEHICHFVMLAAIPSTHFELRSQLTPCIYAYFSWYKIIYQDLQYRTYSNRFHDNRGSNRRCYERVEWMLLHSIAQVALLHRGWNRYAAASLSTFRKKSLILNKWTNVPEELDCDNPKLQELTLGQLVCRHFGCVKLEQSKKSALIYT